MIYYYYYYYYYYDTTLPREMPHNKLKKEPKKNPKIT